MWDQVFSMNAMDETHNAEGLELCYDITGIADAWAIAPHVVRRIFRDEPGVICIPGPNYRNGRKYQSIRVPHSVYERVLARLRRTR